MAIIVTLESNEHFQTYAREASAAVSSRPRVIRFRASRYCANEYILESAQAIEPESDRLREMIGEARVARGRAIRQRRPLWGARRSSLERLERAPAAVGSDLPAVVGLSILANSEYLEATVVIGSHRIRAQLAKVLRGAPAAGHLP
jgi:hypothetical protein